MSAGHLIANGDCPLATVIPRVLSCSLQAWSKVDANASKCDPLTPQPLEKLEDEKERKRVEWGNVKFAYDVVVSDKIGPRRGLEPMYHHL